MGHAMTRHALAVVAALMLAGCSDNGNRIRDPLNDPTPTPTPVPPAATLTVDYRVTGNVHNTGITYFSSTQGTTQVTTDLPWVITFQSTDLHPFLYLAAATPVDQFVEGNLVVQIFVNGVLFREARGSGFTLELAASGEVP